MRGHRKQIDMAEVYLKRVAFSEGCACTEANLTMIRDELRAKEEARDLSSSQPRSWLQRLLARL